VTNVTDDERSERSRRYPVSTVVDAIANLASVHRGVGMNGGSREALAQAIGHSTLNGASKRKIASLIQYGLIDRDGDRYRISDLGRRILIPVTEREKEDAIAEAVRRPALFQEIGQSYDQQPLPSMLGNILAREYGLLPAVSGDVAELFKKSVEQAGLIVDGSLNWSGAPRAAVANPADAPAQLQSTREPTGDTRSTESASDASLGGLQDYSIPLDSRGRKALIHLPTPVEARDLDRLAGWLSYMRTVLSDTDDTSATS
jgi:hypothetical protein